MSSNRPLLCLASLCIGCAAEDYAQLYASQDLAPSLDWSEVGQLEHMGAVLIDDAWHAAAYS